MDEGAVIRELVAAWVARMPSSSFSSASIHHAYGRAPPPSGATLSNGPRFLIPVRGSGRVQIPQGASSTVIDFAPGMVLAIDPGCWHFYERGDLALVGCFVHRDYVLFNHWQQGPGSRRSIHCTADGLPRAIAFAARALATMPSDHPDYTLCCRHLIEVLIRHIVHHLLSSTPAISPGRSRWQAISAWIDDHLHQAMDRNQVARHFGIHPNHITRICAEHAPQGFTATVIQRRCQRAAHLLHHSELSIAELGARCGYPDPSAFAHAFKQWSGYAPREFRSQGDISVLAEWTSV